MDALALRTEAAPTAKAAATTSTTTAEPAEAAPDDEGVGAKALDLLLHRLRRAVPDRDHQDDRADPDEDAEHGECGAHPVGHEPVERDAETLPEAHRAVTGP